MPNTGLEEAARVLTLAQKRTQAWKQAETLLGICAEYTLSAREAMQYIRPDATPEALRKELQMKAAQNRLRTARMFRGRV